MDREMCESCEYLAKNPPTRRTEDSFGKLNKLLKL